MIQKTVASRDIKFLTLSLLFLLIALGGFFLLKYLIHPDGLAFWIYFFTYWCLVFAVEGKGGPKLAEKCGVQW